MEAKRDVWKKMKYFEKSRKIYGESDVKLVDKRNTEKLMDMLRWKEAADKPERSNDVRWYGHVLRQPEENVWWRQWYMKWIENLNRANQEWNGRSKFKENWFKDEADRYTWRDVGRVTDIVKWIQPPPINGEM